jgi:oxygen-independent coproporphyrinogen-3 oxidase
MNPETVKRYSAPVPRYTSYPTAPHFSSAIGPEQYAEWLGALIPESSLSLYLHIPFCDELCWYCGCCTKAVRRYDPVSEYLGVLHTEIANVSRRLSSANRVSHVHWGGGSPNILSAADIARLAGAQREQFRMVDGAEFAVEIDPRGLDEARVAAFAEAGVTRVSLGVQDFDLKVQAAINRRQSFEETRFAANAFRAHGIDAINIDVVYGLPHQTRESVQRTIAQVLELKPARVAAFGYAHLPSRLKHQRMIDDANLPDAVERFAQAGRITRALLGAGYVRVGLDHYALRDDPLASGSLARNFQGYTTDTAEALIGLGASAIGRLPHGYVQNHASTAEYMRAIGQGTLATVRGFALSEADRMRGFVIERIMCDLEFPARELRLRFGEASDEILKEAQDLIEADQDRLVERDGDAFRITDRGRPFVRSIAACFDAYLDVSPARHAPGV